MSLQLLSEEAPVLSESTTGKRYTLAFISTSTGDKPALYLPAINVSSSFPLAYTIVDVSQRQLGRDESGNRLYRFDVTAQDDLSMSNATPDGSTFEPEEDWDFAEETRNIMLPAGTLVEGFVSVCGIYRIRQVYSLGNVIGRSNGYAKIKGLIGKVNSTDNVPFPGADQYKWKLVGAPMRRIRGGKVAVTWLYKDAGQTLDDTYVVIDAEWHTSGNNGQDKAYPQDQTFEAADIGPKDVF